MMNPNSQSGTLRYPLIYMYTMLFTCAAHYLMILYLYCYLNKRECDLNQSEDDSFVERVAKNNS